MEYTKGEWKASEQEQDFYGKDYYAVRSIHDGRIQRVADVWIEANAHLIAAAPDMYEALKSIVKDVDETGYCRVHHIVTGQQALAKAEGRE